MRERVIVFGTGKKSEAFVNENRETRLFRIIAFCDNNSLKWGTCFHRKRVISRADLKNYEYDAILIFSDSVEAIRTQLITENDIRKEIIHDYRYRESDRVKRRYRVYYKRRSGLKKGGHGVSIKKREQLIIYTAIYGGYDNLNEPEFIDNNCKYICFTDNKDLKSDLWEIRYKTLDKYGTPLMRAKWCKMHPHVLFPNNEWSIWVDGKAKIIGDLRSIIKDYSKSSNMLCFLHPIRRTIAEEIIILTILKRDSEETMKRQYNRFVIDGFKDDNELIEGQFLARRHNKADVIEVMREWWRIVCRGSYRDQISFNYVAWKKEFRFDVTDLNAFDNTYFIDIPHNR